MPTFGQCYKCGADMARSPHTGKLFCSQKCWLKSENSIIRQLNGRALYLVLIVILAIIGLGAINAIKTESPIAYKIGQETGASLWHIINKGILSRPATLFWFIMLIALMAHARWERKHR